MNARQVITIFCLVANVFAYSQIELTDNKGDTLICITYPQMDRIYLELIQKDSLLAQSQISHFKELKYIELIDNTKKDINSLKTYINSIEEDNNDLLTISKIQEHKIKRNRKIGLVMLGVIVLQAIL